jgi:tetratricopeptide (TPR) repeat protein
MLRRFAFLSLFLCLDCAAAQDRQICFNPPSPPAAIVEACTALIEADPTHTGPEYQARGTAWYRLGEFDRAIADYTNAIDISPSYIRAYYNRALAWEAKGDYDEALDDLQLFVSLDPTRLPDAHTAIARITEARRKSSQKTTQQAQAKSKFDQFKGNAALTDPCLNSSGQAVVAACAKGIESPATTKDDLVRYYIKRGDYYFDQGDDQRAIDDYSAALKFDPVSIRALVGRGTGYTSARRYDLAISDLSEAIRLRPKDGIIYVNRGMAYDVIGDRDRALADYTDAITLKPDVSSGAYFNRALIYDLKGDRNKAVADLSAAIKIDPKFARAYEKRGALLLLSGETERALDDFNRAIRLDEKLPVSYFNRGLIYKMRGDSARAESDFKEAFRLNPRLAPNGRQADTTPALATPYSHNVSSARRVALVIGNSAYQNVALLPNPVRDESTVADALRRAGFQTVVVSTDLKRETFVQTLRDFAAYADKADWAVVYFSGHGMEVAGVNYLIPIDAKLSSDRDLQFEAIPLDHVLSAVEGAKHLRLVMLDACRDNPFISQMRRSVTSRSIGRGLAPVEPEPGTLVVYAAKHGETALDGDGPNSPFASSFVKRMSTPGLEVRRLFDLVRDDVLALTDRRQQPFSYGSLPGNEDFFFVSKSPDPDSQMPPVIGQLRPGQQRAPEDRQLTVFPRERWFGPDQ